MGKVMTKEDKHADRTHTCLNGRFYIGKKGKINEHRSHRGYKKDEFSYKKHICWLMLKDVINDDSDIESKKHQINQIYTIYQKKYKDIYKSGTTFFEKKRVIDTCMKMITDTYELISILEEIGEIEGHVDYKSELAKVDLSKSPPYIVIEGEKEGGYDLPDPTDTQYGIDPRGRHKLKHKDFMGGTEQTGYWHANGKLIGETGLFLRTKDKGVIWIDKRLSNWHTIYHYPNLTDTHQTRDIQFPFKPRRIDVPFKPRRADENV
ncbi:hypothetical protein MBGDF03_00123 [Thermoplasmatales archaeon SCGC AB-540-F20]|nr:hypothetical protein MBGDF03_00123 [Thermoplasmatales archaeon SCGC AB-540-F20]